jgi:hypothetical protein
MEPIVLRTYNESVFQMYEANFNITINKKKEIYKFTNTKKIIFKRFVLDCMSEGLQHIVPILLLL